MSSCQVLLQYAIIIINITVVRNQTIFKKILFSIKKKLFETLFLTRVGEKAQMKGIHI